ncbi:MAG: hypothetical protein ACI4W6_03270, partial [Acutalibacteraceae bacterium]
ASVYVEQKKYADAISLFLEIRTKFDGSSDASGEFAKNTCSGIIKAYFGLNQEQKAYDFAWEEAENLEKWFGKYSIIRIDEIIKIGAIFRENGFIECLEFFELAATLLCEAELTKTIQYAIVLNYIGVCKTDYEQKHVEASRYFEQSKALFEELGETENEVFKTVLNNIEYIEDLKMNELIKNLASSLSDPDDANT